MSARNDGNELWFCHECHAEMRPLMVPTPHCASCNSDFVEKIENQGGEDDPREYMQGGGVPGDLDVFGTLLANMLMGGVGGRPPGPGAGRTLGGGGGGGGLRFELHTGGSGGTTSRTFVLGGPNTLGGQRDDGQPPLLAPFLDDAFRHDLGDERPNADRPRGERARMPMHPLFNPAILALLGGHPMMAGGMRNGQMGDYVLDQDAMDQILTQLMEAGNAHRPVPAPEDQIAHLPRRKATVQNYLDADEETRNRECAVCKDTLLPSPDSTETEVQLVKLPCVHEFHEDCIVPWLKNSGTCPVCRHQLVAQPAPHGHDQPPQQPHEQRERSDRGTNVPNIPGLRTLGNIASNVYHQLRHPGSSSHPSNNNNNTNSNTNNPGASHSNNPGEPSSSSASPQSAGSSPSQGTFGHRSPSPTMDYYHMVHGNGGRPYSPRPPRRTNSGGYVLGSSPPRAGRDSPETRRPYAFAPPRELYNPWDTAPAPGGSQSPTHPAGSPGPGGQRSPRDGARSSNHSRRPSNGTGNNNGNPSSSSSSNRPRSPGPGLPPFPGGWHDLD